jgi:hypothetical protein
VDSENVHVVIFFGYSSSLGKCDHCALCVSMLSTFEPAGKNVNNTVGHTVAFFNILHKMVDT